MMLKRGKSFIATADGNGTLPPARYPPAAKKALTARAALRKAPQRAGRAVAGRFGEVAAGLPAAYRGRPIVGGSLPAARSSVQNRIATAMSLSMYEASIPAVRQTLSALSGILDKASAHATERKIDPAVLLGTRLFPDMFPLVRQVQLTTDFAKGIGARLAGVELPKFADAESTFEELQARIGRTQDFLKGLNAAQFEGSETREITLPIGGESLRYSGQEYLFQFALPNLYFHATTAYALLRHCGVELGKRDFMGALPK
jgi:hypothetical protein